MVKLKLDFFTIKLTRENGIYFPGEEVNGNLLVKSKEFRKINSIVLEFKGETGIRWDIGSGEYSDTHYDKKVLFQFLLTYRTGEFNPDANEFICPFKFSLPSTNLSTSLELNFGVYVRYLLKATILIPCSKKPKNYTVNTVKCITVVNPLDLNLGPSLRECYLVSDNKTFGWCSKSDSIAIEFKTNKTGYVAGETIFFNVSINNRSLLTVKSISCTLVQLTHLYSKGVNVSEIKRKIATLKYNGPKIRPRMRENWSDAKLKIPSVCPSIIDTSSMIINQYRLKLFIKVNYVVRCKSLNIPILIGTVPFNDANISLPSHLEIKYCKTIIKRDGSANTNWENDDEMCPDSIEFHNNENKFKSIKHFQPRYPYHYNIPIYI